MLRRAAVIGVLCAATTALTFPAMADRAAPQAAIRETIVSPQEFTSAMQGVAQSEMDYAAFKKMQADGNPLILDVRSKEAFAREHIHGAVSLPLTDMTEKTLAEVAPDKDRPVIVMCDFSLAPTRMVSMTMQAFPVLKVNGYKNIYRLNLWQNAPREGYKDIAFDRAPEPVAVPPQKPVADYVCDPADFTMTQTAEGISFKGKIATPNAYYYYSFGNEGITIHTPVDYLSDADRTTPGQVEIDALLKEEGKPSYTILIHKDYAGGIDKIVCNDKNR